MFSFLLAACTSAEKVGGITSALLTERYDRRFEAFEVDMQRNEGNWGRARLSMRSDDNPPVEFRANYNYTRRELMFEDYLPSLWSRTILGEIRAGFALSFREGGEARVRISEAGSIALNGMRLPVVREYREALREIGPTMMLFNADLKAKPAGPGDALLKTVRRLALEYRDAGFTVVAVELNFFADPPRRDRGRPVPEYTLRFRLTDRLPVPAPGELHGAVNRYGDPLLYSMVKEPFLNAQELRATGRIEEALAAFRTIIETWDYPWRYRPYIEAQSAWIYESMIAAGDILHALDRDEEAAEYYRAFLDRIAWVSAKRELLDEEKRVRAILGESPSE